MKRGAIAHLQLWASYNHRGVAASEDRAPAATIR